MAGSSIGNPSSSFQMSRHQEEVLESAAKLVDCHLQQDNLYPQLVDLLKINSGVPSVSGLSDQDYPGLSELNTSLHSLSQLCLLKKVPLPTELVEQFGHMQSNCQMGLFPEIGRAWLTIDSNIFVWTFEDGGDLAYFDGLSETILSVGLVKPKPGIFQSYIAYVLCLTTPVEMVLLGVSFSKNSKKLPMYDEMHLIPEPLFSIPTDNNYIMKILGTSLGRIFMGGRDGCLYELAYQAESGWFTRRCYKINHSSSALSYFVPSFFNFAFSEEDPLVQLCVDNSRNILYTRSEKGTIQVFSLGSSGDQMMKVASLSQNTIAQQAMNIAKTIDKSNFRPIVHINALELSESLHIHLLAITLTGVRLYFTTTSFSFPNVQPFTLSLLHVRLPPGFSANAPPQRPNHVHMAYYKKGCVLLACSQSDNQDVLWAMTNDSFPFQHQLIELHTTMLVDGKTWTLSEVPVDKASESSSSIVINNNIIFSKPPLVVSQHMEYPRKFVLLSAQGTHIITKPRPVDQLKKLLLDNKGPDCEAVKAFFYLHKATQACAICLILACSPSAEEKQISEWATRALFLYGGDAHISYPAAAAVSGNLPMSPSMTTPTTGQVWTSTPLVGIRSQASTPVLPSQGLSGLPYTPVTNISSVFNSFAQDNPYQQPSSMLTQQQTGQGPEVIYSGRHNGLYLYFSRILRPLWNTNVAYGGGKINEVQQPLYSGVSSDDLSLYVEQLAALRTFIQANFQYLGNPTPANVSITQNIHQRVLNFIRPDSFTAGEVNQMQQQLQKKSQAEAELQERTSVSNLQQLITHTCEVVGFWKILCDHQFHIMASSLSVDIQNQLNVWTFRDLIVRGKEVCGFLVGSLLTRYLDDSANVDAISHRLREICPSIYRNEDALFSKAHEMLLNVKNITTKQEREKELKDALQICKEISPHLKLKSVCGLFQSVHFYYGIVDLCLSAAQRRDPQNLGLHYYKSGEPSEDQNGFQAYISRMDCYKTIMEILVQLKNLSRLHPQSPSVPKVPGPPPIKDPNLLSPEEAIAHFDQMLQMVFKSDDELLHVALYDWLIETYQQDKLLQIKSPHLEDYLKQCVTVQPNNLSSMDLMWKYYEKNKNFSAAARILAKLGDRHGTDISLQQRLEYLSRAIICAKSSEIRITSQGEGEFLHELEEKMEVARIQLFVLDTIEQKSHELPNVEDAISRLNSDLLDITQLYQDFAEIYNLTECKLAIVHCAGHYDPTLVETLWRNIIDKELNSSVESPPQTRMISLSQKIKSLGKTYISSQKYFPVSFLVNHLEHKTCTLKFDPKWVFLSMLAVGVSLPHLFEVYHNLYRSKEPIWHTIRKPLHLLEVISLLIAHFVQAPHSVVQTERRAFITHCQDMVAGYLVDLQGMSSLDNNVQSFIRDFRGLQNRLEQLI